MQKLFGTDGIRGKVGVYPLTEDMIRILGVAAALFVKRENVHKRKAQRISIAKDTRTSGDMFEEKLIEGIISTGVDVVKLGVLPTPCSAYLVRKLKHDLGIVISASHNDIDDNGLKFFTHRGYKLSPEEEEEIERLVHAESAKVSQPDKPTQEQDEPVQCMDEQLQVSGEQLQGKAKDEKNPASTYITMLKEMLSGCDISKYRVIADCAFGSVSRLIPEVSRELNINIATINDTPDGENINNECGSLHPDVVADNVIKEGYDCGFAFDGDADRLIVCDEKGQVLDGDFILAIIGGYLHRKGALNRNSIVTTHMSNLGLEMYISQWGSRLIKAEVGDKFVLDKMLKGKLNLGGEQSGHIILLDYSTTGDALLTGLFLLKIMAEENKSLGELGRCMYKFPQLLVNINVDKKVPFKELPKLNKLIEKCEKKLGSKGRLYIRYSGTENKLRIMVEGQDQIQIRDIADEIVEKAKEELNAQVGC